MAHTLRLTDYTTTINLNDFTSTRLIKYTPQSPNLSTVDLTPESLRDGGERIVTTRRNVTESAEIIIIGSTMDAVRSIVRQIEALLRQAEEYQKRHVGARVYVELDPGASGTVYRSEILSGKVEWPDDTLSMWWANRKTRVVIAWTRRYYWEGPEIELPLTNGNGTNVTGGLTVYNHDDGDAGHDNYVQIAGADVGGVIPAPAKIRTLNTYNSSARSAQFFVAHNAFSTPTSFAHILEAENRNYVAGGAAPTADTSSSGGYRQGISWAGFQSTLPARGATTYLP